MLVGAVGKGGRWRTELQWGCHPCCASVVSV